MKTATMLLAASALLTHAAAMPISTDEDISNLHLPADPNNVSPLVSRDTSSLHPRCTWHDGHGTVNCDTFSVVFGDGSISGGTNLVTISGNNFREKWSVNCDKPDEWKNFNTPLPYVVVIQMGNACRFSPSLPSTWYDGTHIKYANQFLNTPADYRCSRVHQMDKGQRCLIKQRP